MARSEYLGDHNLDLHRALLTRRARTVCSTDPVITVFGVVALTFMMAMYALENRRDTFIAAFAAGCALSSIYGFLSGAWPFGTVEAIWSVIAIRRYQAAAAR